jgi:hypothetical protein
MCASRYVCELCVSITRVFHLVGASENRKKQKAKSKKQTAAAAAAAARTATRTTCLTFNTGTGPPTVSILAFFSCLSRDFASSFSSFIFMKAGSGDDVTNGDVNGGQGGGDDGEF